jgi:lactobin A/cerein 7B family class IIb bacteriocin
MFMRELNHAELSTVSGGLAPVALLAFNVVNAAVGAYGIGYAIGRQFS